MRLWPPTTFLRLIDALDTSMGTARIKTDAGPAYIKVMGNRQGPHQLACELIGTQLARWLGLPTFDFALLLIDEATDGLTLARGVKAKSGPAFVTRAMAQRPWGGSEKELLQLTNPEAVSFLVVFDTWTRNCDRYPPDITKRRPNYDNVFLERLPGAKSSQVRLIAMDHSCCFTCNDDIRARDLRRIAWIQDDRVFGLFPAFRPLIRQSYVRRAITRLNAVDVRLMEKIVASVPDEWELSKDARDALANFLVQRAAYVAKTIEHKIQRLCWPDQLFDVNDVAENEL